MHFGVFTFVYTIFVKKLTVCKCSLFVYLQFSKLILLFEKAWVSGCEMLGFRL